MVPRKTRKKPQTTYEFVIAEVARFDIEIAFSSDLITGNVRLADPETPVFEESR